MNRFPAQVRIVEVGPRDGLQNEATPVPTSMKTAFIQKLVEAGLSDIEVTSFVHPQRVPQLADAATLWNTLPKVNEVTFSALVPNERGLDRAIEAGVKRVAVFTAASETFARKNIHLSIGESLAVFERIIERALSQDLSVRGYLSTCFVCPYEGNIAKERVRELAAALIDLGVDEVSISDTVGAASPKDVFDTVECVLDRVPVEHLALHFHDTYGTALANVLAGLELGVKTYDASAGGLGGCPFAPGASGNLATEDLLYMLDRMDIESGVSLERIIEAATFIAGAIGRMPSSRQWAKKSDPNDSPSRPPDHQPTGD